MQRKYSDISADELNALEKSTITKSIPKAFVEACVDHLVELQELEWVSKKSFNEDGTAKRATALQFWVKAFLEEPDKPVDVSLGGRVFMNPQYASKEILFATPEQKAAEAAKKLGAPIEVKSKKELGKKAMVVEESPNQKFIKHFGLQKLVAEIYREFRNADNQMMEKIMTDLGVALMANERCREVISKAFPDGSKEQNALCNQLVLALAYKITCLCQEMLASDLVEKYKAEGREDPVPRANMDAFKRCAAPLGFRNYDFADNTSPGKWQQNAERQKELFPTIGGGFSATATATASKADTAVKAEPAAQSAVAPASSLRSETPKTKQESTSDQTGYSTKVQEKLAGTKGLLGVFGVNKASREADRQAKMEAEQRRVEEEQKIKQSEERVKAQLALQEAKSKGLVGEMPSNEQKSPRK